MQQELLQQWHDFVGSQALEGLDELLADDAVFHSPVVHTPQVGKELTKMYLTGAYHVLKDSGFRYVREVASDNNAILEFTAEIDGIHINGVDMIHWNDQGKIDDFKVMIRPLKAVNLLHSMMRAALEQISPG